MGTGNGDGAFNGAVDLINYAEEVLDIRAILAVEEHLVFSGWGGQVPLHDLLLYCL